jgi:hypothetical protein
MSSSSTDPVKQFESSPGEDLAGTFGLQVERNPGRSEVMQVQIGVWPAPTSDPFPPPAASSAHNRSQRVLVGFGLLALVASVVGLAVFIRHQPERSDFAAFQARADELAKSAASFEKSLVGVSPDSWVREEWRIDQASRAIAIDRWQHDEPVTGGPPLLSFIFYEDAHFISSPRFDDPSSARPTWYLNEESDGMEPATFDLHVAPPWEFLDFTDDEPRWAASELSDGEQLDRFDLTIPAEAFTEGEGVTYETVGWIDPSNGVEVSFWFAGSGELRRMTIEGDGEIGFTSVEYRSRSSATPIPLERPPARRSWREVQARDD